MNITPYRSGAIASLFLLGACLPVGAISFVNPDLEGTAALNAVPSGWTVHPVGTAYSDADFLDGTTPDIVSLTGPRAGTGNYGTPHSGNTFVGGLHLYVPAAEDYYQEGIQQTVGGFTIGQQYSFSFYQGVAVGNAGQQQTGSWEVYANDTLITTTLPSTTTVSWNTPGKPLVWDQRTVTFTATSETMKLGFLPSDLDGNITSAVNAVYMGIDSFSEISPVPEPSTVVMGLVAALGLLRRRR